MKLFFSHSLEMHEKMPFPHKLFSSLVVYIWTHWDRKGQHKRTFLSIL